MSNNTGKVSQIIGPVVDVVFDNNENELPNIYDSLEITRENGSKLVLECQQHIGEDTVRAIAMETTSSSLLGIPLLNCPRGGGEASLCCSITDRLPPSKGTRPASIS